MWAAAAAAAAATAAALPLFSAAAAATAAAAAPPPRSAAAAAAAAAAALPPLSAAAAAAPPLAATFTIHAAAEAQVILGLGFEIQSDSIGSGNHGLPDSNTSVPWSLTPPERARFAADMLAGFRYCRLATGLYFRGLTPDGKNFVERWPGQAAAMADMAAASGIEGFAVEAWSPPPVWKDTQAFIGGSLASLAPAFLADFAAAAVTDVAYLNAQSLPVVWWGLQNEPPVGCSGGCIYSCCCYNASAYTAAFNATAAAVRAAHPDVVIHASSWSGQKYAPQISADPAILALVDAWTWHCVGCTSDDQLPAGAAGFLEDASGRPVFNNEFEYLSEQTSPWRCINTAQSIMNWMAFINSPIWYWLHALKPIGNAEAAGYALGFFNPPVNSSTDPSAPPPGAWDYQPDNWPAVAGFTRYMPWDSPRVNVSEATVDPDVRVLAYRFDPAKARWRAPGGAPPAAPRRGATAAALRGGDAPLRAAATKLAFVLTNRLNATVVNATVALDGLGAAWRPAGAPALPTFTGHLYAPGNVTDAPLGTATATAGGPGGLPFVTVTLAPLSINFWVED
jgi:O-glycosyl hydrolase